MEEQIKLINDKMNLMFDKLSVLEESMKIILVNDVLKDAERITDSETRQSRKDEELQDQVDILKMQLENSADTITRLQQQNEQYRRRIQTLQELVDSKDRTIQAKEKRIELLQGSTVNKPERSGSNSNQFKIGQRVKLSRSCIVYYENYNSDKKSITSFIAGAYSKEYTIEDAYDTRYKLSYRNPNGYNYDFWVDKNMVIPC